MTAKTTTTTDAEGAVVSVQTEPRVATISFGRKVGLPNYSNEEMTLFLQVPLPDGDLAAIETALNPEVAFVKAYVYKQLGVEILPDGDVIRGAVPQEQPKGTTTRKGSGGRSAAAKAAPAASDEDKQAAWAELAMATVDPTTGYIKTQDGENVYDNRDDKRNPKAPDFKFASSGRALWMKNPDGTSAAPDWFQGPGRGI